MTIRFFILQAHYRSTLDFSNEALQAAEKGLERLMKAYELLEKITPSEQSSIDASSLLQNCYDAMNDDFNSPIVIANLFEAVRMINAVNDGHQTIDAKNLEVIKTLFSSFLFEILGMSIAENSTTDHNKLDEVVDFLLNIRMEAKANKDWATSDKIRNGLTSLGFEIRDKKDGFEWELKG